MLKEDIHFNLKEPILGHQALAGIGFHGHMWLNSARAPLFPDQMSILKGTSNSNLKGLEVPVAPNAEFRV